MEKRGIVETGRTPCDHVCCCHPADEVNPNTKHACCGKHKKKDGIKQSSLTSEVRFTAIADPIE